MANCGTPVAVSTLYATSTDFFTSTSTQLVTAEASGTGAGSVSTSTVLVTGSSTRVVPTSTVFSTPPCTSAAPQTSAAANPTSAAPTSTRAPAASSERPTTSTLVATSLSTSNGNVVQVTVTQVVVGAGPSSTVVSSNNGSTGQTVGNSSGGGGSSRVGPIVGGVVGGVVALLLAALLARWFILRKRRARDSEKLDAFFGDVNVSRGHSLDGSANGGAGGGLGESKLSGDGAAQARPPQPWGSPSAAPAMSEAGYGAAGWGAHDAAQRASGYYGPSTQMHSTAPGMYPEQSGYGNVARNPSGSSAHANHVAQQAYGVAAGALATVGAAGAADAYAHSSAPNTMGRNAGAGNRNSMGRPLSSGGLGGAGRTYSQSSGGDRSHPGSPQFAPHRAISPPPRQPSNSPPPQPGMFPPSRYGHLDVGVAPATGGSPASQSPGISRETSLSAMPAAAASASATPPTRSVSGDASRDSVQAYQASMARQASEALVASKSPPRRTTRTADDDGDVAAEREAAAKLWGAHRGLHVANGADVQTP